MNNLCNKHYLRPIIVAILSCTIKRFWFRSLLFPLAGHFGKRHHLEWTVGAPYHWLIPLLFACLSTLLSTHRLVVFSFYIATSKTLTFGTLLSLVAMILWSISTLPSPCCCCHFASSWEPFVPIFDHRLTTLLLLRLMVGASFPLPSSRILTNVNASRAQAPPSSAKCFV